MRPSRTPCTTLWLSGLLISTVANAQSTVEEMAPLPTIFSTEQLESLLQLSAGANPEAPQPHARRRLPRPELHVNPRKPAIGSRFRSLAWTITGLCTVISRTGRSALE